MYKHLSEQERYRIQILIQDGKSNREISRYLKRSPSTIGREIQRNGTSWKYLSQKAQEFAEERKRKARHVKITEKMWQEVFERFNQDHSPEQISGALALEGIQISHETIYQRIYREIEAGRLDRKHLRWFRKKRRRRIKPREKPDETKISIEKRPPEVAQRKEFGHWEGDTVELKRGSAYLVTLVERKTRFLMTALVTSKKSEDVRVAIEAQFGAFKHTALSITFDNGTEFAQHQKLAENLSADIYFAHPHSPWERGTNENTNRLLRQYFPKGKVEKAPDSAFLSLCRQKINTRPRKCLGFATPASAFSRYSKLSFP